MTTPEVELIPGYITRDLLNEEGEKWVRTVFETTDEGARMIIGEFMAAAIQGEDEPQSVTIRRADDRSLCILSYEPGVGLSATLTPDTKQLYPVSYYTPRYGETSVLVHVRESTRVKDRTITRKRTDYPPKTEGKATTNTPPKKTGQRSQKAPPTPPTYKPTGKPSNQTNKQKSTPSKEGKQVNLFDLLCNS